LVAGDNTPRADPVKTADGRQSPPGRHTVMWGGLSSAKPCTRTRTRPRNRGVTVGLFLEVRYAVHGLGELSLKAVRSPRLISRATYSSSRLQEVRRARYWYGALGPRCQPPRPV